MGNKLKFYQFLFLIIPLVSLTTILRGDCPHCYKVANVIVIDDKNHENIGYIGIYGSMYRDLEDYEPLVEGMEITGILDLPNTISFADSIYSFPHVGDFFMSEEIRQIEIGSKTSIIFLKWENLHGAGKFNRLSRENITKLNSGAVTGIAEVDGGISTYKYINLNQDIPDWEFRLFVENFLIRRPYSGLVFLMERIFDYELQNHDSLMNSAGPENPYLAYDSEEYRNNRRPIRGKMRTVNMAGILDLLKRERINTEYQQKRIITEYTDSIWRGEIQYFDGYFRRLQHLYFSLDEYINRNNNGPLSNILSEYSLGLKADQTEDINIRLIRTAEIISELFVQYKWSWDKRYNHYQPMLPDWRIIEVQFAYD